MKQAKGWAARVKRIEENNNAELLAIADDLAASIKNACYVSSFGEPQLHHPTAHMAGAVYRLTLWKNRNAC